MAIQNAREGVAGDAQYPCRLRHVQAKRYQAVFPDAAAGGGEGVLQSAPWTLRSYPDLLALSGADLADPGPYLICPETDPWPRRRHQHQDRQFSVSQVLLVAEALICRDEELIALLLRSIEQGAIAKLGPSPFKGRVHTVLPQVPTKRHRSSLIEQYLHEATDSARVRSS